MTREKGEAGRVRWQLTRLAAAIFFTMNVMVFTLVLWSGDWVAADSEGAAAASTLYQLFRYICLLFATPVLLLLGLPLLESALDDLARRRLSTDLLIVLGVAAAFTYSLISVLRGEGHVYFEVACMVLVAVTLGRWLEAAGKHRTTEALRGLEKLLPERVTRIESGGPDREIPLEEVTAGDLLRVRAGERLPVDGEVARGAATVDQQVATGESEPVVLEAGSRVFGGSLNLDGELIVRASASAKGGLLQQMVDSLVAAAARDSRPQRLADRIAGWFLPAVCVIAVATLLLQGWLVDWETGLLASLAVVLIACPCALGIATPLAVWSALGRASRRQVLVRDSDALSRLPDVAVAAFDKTGTLTTGRPRVVEFLTADEISPHDAKEALALAGRIARGSGHRLSAAISQFLEHQAEPAETDYELREHAGRGVEATATNDRATGPRHVLLGSRRWLQEQGLEARDDLCLQMVEAEAAGHALVAIGWDGRVQGCFAIAEELRTDAAAALAELNRRGMNVVVLTGDSRVRAERLAAKLGVETRAELLPADKTDFVKHLQQTSPVMMVGDGLNDAPALAAADVGVALGCGADVARHSAAVCLLSSQLDRLPWLLDLARETRQTVRGNLFWAFSYNTLGIAVAAAGWLHPIMAAGAMIASSLIVVTRSLRLGHEPDSAADARSPAVAGPALGAATNPAAEPSLTAAGAAGGGR